MLYEVRADPDTPLLVDRVSPEIRIAGCSYYAAGRQGYPPAFDCMCPILVACTT